MTNVVFKLRDGTPGGEIGAALKEICSIQELFNVKAVFPDEADQGRRLVYTGSVNPDTATPDVLRSVKAAPYVEYAKLAPERKAL